MLWLAGPRILLLVGTPALPICSFVCFKCSYLVEVYVDFGLLFVFLALGWLHEVWYCALFAVSHSTSLSRLSCGCWWLVIGVPRRIGLEDRLTTEHPVSAL